jgi:hypothetical protein
VLSLLNNDDAVINSIVLHFVPFLGLVSDKRVRIYFSH